MKYRKFLISIFCLVFISIWFNVETPAADLLVSCDEETYSLGDIVSIYISVPDDEIIGLMGDVSYDGSVLSATKDTDYPENTKFAEDSNSAVVYLEATGYGETKVSVSATFSNGDKNDKHDASGYVWIKVTESQEYLPDEDAWNDINETEIVETTEETTVDPKLEKLNVTVGDAQLKVLQEFEHANEDKVGDSSAIATQKDAALEWLPELVGFTTETVDFEGNSVNVYRFNDLLDVYVLTDMSGANGAYYVYDEETKTFEPLAYLYVGNKLVTFADFPSEQDVPDGYELTDVNVGSGTVKGLKYIVEKKGSSLVPLVSSNPDEFYIIYGIAEGQSGFYSYDSVDQAAQRFNLPGYTEEETSVTAETKEVKQVVTEEKNSETDLKYLIIVVALLICLVIAVILAIVFASKNKKTSRKLEESERDWERDKAKNKRIENNVSHNVEHKNSTETQTRINSMFEEDDIDDEEITALDETLDLLADEIADEIDSENNITKE